MKYVPHEYQTYATDFILTHPISAILLQMGLGKSVITLTALYDGSGRLRGFGKVIRDVTEQRAAERRLSASASRQARAAMGNSQRSQYRRKARHWAR